MRDNTEPEVGRPGPRSRWRSLSTRRRWIVGVAVGVLSVALVTGGVYAWWLGGGLLSVSTTVQDKADIAQKRLQKFRTTLKDGDQAKAQAHLRAAERALDEARDATRAPQVRIAKLLPYTRSTVSDLDHLLAAATVMIDSADDALTLYSDFSGADSGLFQDGRFDLEALTRGRDALLTMTAALDRAESELEQVDGEGPMGDEALDKKRTGLKQIRSLQAEIEPFAPVIEALPSAVGADGTRRYLVAVMNPAEMRASGGAPLSVALVVFKNGKLTVPLKGTTSSITLGSPEGLLGDSPELVWKRVKGDPFQPPLGEPQRFVNTGFNPDFRVSGEQMMRATPSFFGMKTDGVIALDVVALAHLLDVVGPIESDYGTLTSDNLADELLVKAYAEQGTDVLGRQERNDKLMSTMLSELMAGGDIRSKITALNQAVPARHLQMYFRDDRLQRVVERMKLAGAVPNPKAGNLTAVYTQNGNGSKLDVFQQRTVDETIRLREDGSALVRRTVRLDNASPPYSGDGPDIKRGYLTRWATNLVINLMPQGATVTSEPEVELSGTVEKGTDQNGRTFAQAAVVTPPGEATEVSWEYELPRAAVKEGGAWRLVDRVVPQNTLNGFLLRTTVVAPDGWTVNRIDDSQPWYVNGNQAFLQIGVSAPLKLQLLVGPA
jgi:hypothetical protein